MTDFARTGPTSRVLDTGTKLLGLALTVAGLEVGATTAVGAALLATGIASGTITAFIHTNE